MQKCSRPHAARHSAASIVQAHRICALLLSRASDSLLTALTLEGLIQELSHVWECFGYRRDA